MGDVSAVLLLETWFVPGVAGLFGLAVGSFLNVCTLRWPLEESVVEPPSHCPQCGTRLRWKDNVPVLSWLLLRGRCRTCDTAISVQYPLVELTTAIVWAGMFAGAGGWLEAVRGAIFLTLLLGIAVSDARFYIIPNEFTLGGAGLGLLMAFFPGGITIVQALVGAVVGYAALRAIGILGTWLFDREAMGGGDMKMMAMVGAFLGVPGVLLTVFLGALLGAVIFGPISWKTGKLVPFGIFLSAGAAVSYAWGDVMIGWYVAEILGM